MDCIRNCVVNHIGAENFERHRTSREMTLKIWLHKKAIYDQRSLALDQEMDKKQQEHFDLSVEKERLSYKVQSLETAIKNNNKHKKSYCEEKTMINKLIISP